MNDFYNEKEDFSIGGLVSPSFANIFVNILEQEIMKNHVNSEDIISYHKYLDDIFCIAKKGMKDNILDEMNKFDPVLKFTIENMTNNGLNF